MMDEIIKSLRTDLRLAMNGIVSSSMRDKGANYKMNFGVDVPRLKKIAENYEPSAALANELWKLDVRELKILSTMLYPVNEFTEKEANRWVSEIPNQEIRENLCKNLLQELSYADKLVQVWSADAQSSIRITGFWLYVRLMLIKSAAVSRIDTLPIVEKALDDVLSDDSLLHRAALNVLTQVTRRNKEMADLILNRVKKYATSTNPKEKEIYENLQFEFSIRS